MKPEEYSPENPPTRARLRKTTLETRLDKVLSEQFGSENVRKIDSLDKKMTSRSLMPSTKRQQNKDFLNYLNLCHPTVLEKKDADFVNQDLLRRILYGGLMYGAFGSCTVYWVLFGKNVRPGLGRALLLGVGGFTFFSLCGSGFSMKSFEFAVGRLGAKYAKQRPDLVEEMDRLCPEETG